MTKRVQILGHIAELALEFIGFAREVTADIDNWDLILHDGVTPGGYRFLNRDANDERYQARSVELDGLLGWEPNERGIVTRLGPSTYRLREIEVDEASLTVDFSDGHDGNPKLALAPEITDDHTWSGDQTFTAPIIAAGGVVGDVTGNLEGDSTGLHTGDVIGDVTGNLTGDSQGFHTGGIDTRGGAVTMGDGQIDPDWIDGFEESLALAGLPVGSVTMFALDLSDIPANWKLCDGTNGTPDLRDKFVVGAGVDYPFASSGGAATHNHAATSELGGSHSHTGAVGDTALILSQIPAHRHNNGVTDQSTDKIFCYGGTAAAAGSWNHVEDSGGGSGVNQGFTSKSGGALGGGDAADPHSHELTTEPGGAHTHDLTTEAASSLPPYLALYYIMKVA